MIIPGKLYRIKKIVYANYINNKIVVISANTILLGLTSNKNWSTIFGDAFTECFFLYEEKIIKISLTECNSVLSVEKILEEIE